METKHSTKAFEEGREDFFSQQLDQKRLGNDAEYCAGADEAAADYEQYMFRVSA